MGNKLLWFNPICNVECRMKLYFIAALCSLLLKCVSLFNEIFIQCYFLFSWLQVMRG